MIKCSRTATKWTPQNTIVPISRINFELVLQEGTSKFANLDNRLNNKNLNRVSRVEIQTCITSGTDGGLAFREADFCGRSLG